MTGTRLSINLSTPAKQALDELAATSGTSKTDLVDRAVRLYCYLTANTKAGTSYQLTRGMAVEELGRQPGWLIEEIQP
jgi:predicted transcriptional regulator